MNIVIETSSDGRSLNPKEYPTFIVDCTVDSLEVTINKVEVYSEALNTWIEVTPLIKERTTLRETMIETAWDTYQAQQGADLI